VTDKTPPQLDISWEPIAEGVKLHLGYSRREHTQISFDIPITSVNEFHADMEEASYLANGYEKVECEVYDILSGDRIRLMGNTYMVTDLLQSSHGWVVQFEPHQWTETSYELTMDSDETVTVWRPVE
jgi:hypothetical protein